MSIGFLLQGSSRVGFTNIGLLCIGHFSRYMQRAARVCFSATAGELLAPATLDLQSGISADSNALCAPATVSDHSRVHCMCAAGHP